VDGDVERVRGLLERHRDYTAVRAQHGFWSTGPRRRPASSRCSRTSTSGFWASFASIPHRMRSHPPQLRRLLRRPQRCTMGKDTGFLEIEREQPTRRKVEERVTTGLRFTNRSPSRSSATRAHAAWIAACRSATLAARSTTSSPTGTTWSTTAAGRLQFDACMPPTTSLSSPAASAPPVRSLLRAGIDQPPVSIKLIERSIVERAWDEGWIQPEPPEQATGKRVAVVGSGPSGWPPRSSYAARPLRHGV